MKNNDNVIKFSLNYFYTIINNSMNNIEFYKSLKDDIFFNYWLNGINEKENIRFILDNKIKNTNLKYIILSHPKEEYYIYLGLIFNNSYDDILLSLRNKLKNIGILSDAKLFNSYNYMRFYKDNFLFTNIDILKKYEKG